MINYGKIGGSNNNLHPIFFIFFQYYLYIHFFKTKDHSIITFLRFSGKKDLSDDFDSLFIGIHYYLTAEWQRQLRIGVSAGKSCKHGNTERRENFFKCI